jgi:alkylhydroperoxidase family enzyme
MLEGQALADAAESVGLPRSFHHLNVFRLLLHTPRLAKVMSSLLVSQLKDSVLDDRLREFVIMRIGWRTGSVYEWTQHWGISVRLGMSEDELLAVRDWRDAGPDVLDERARAVLRATDDVLDGGAVLPDTLAECERVLGDPAQVVALLMAIVTWRSISELLRSLDVPLEAGIEAWPPDGRPGGRATWAGPEADAARGSG